MTDYHHLFSVPVAVAMMVAAPGCGHAATPQGVADITGQWGGEQASLTIAPTGAVLLADCADGSVSTPFRLDANGNFAAMGRFDAFRPGRQMVDEGPGDGIAATAHYVAKVDGNRLELTITSPGAPPRHFMLERGRKVKIIRCL